MMGLWAGDKLKNAAVILLKSYVQRKLVKDFDADTIAELYSFGKVSKEKWGAMGGNHDDHVMCMLWCIYYVNSPLFYGNIAEANIGGIKNPDLILEGQETLTEEAEILKDMKDPTFHMKQLGDAAKYNPYDRNAESDSFPNDVVNANNRISEYGYAEEDIPFTGGFRV